jgi:hypothetical protein
MFRDGRVYSKQFLRLELNSRRKLNAPHGASILRSYNTGNCSGVAILTVDTRVWLTEVHFVEQVEEVGAELETKLLSQAN